MHKLQKLIGLSAMAGLLLSGCGQAGDPEIIMPDTPMQPSAAASGGVTAEPVAAVEETGDAGVQETQPAAGAGEAHTVYLITMDLADSYWQSIDKGCKQAAASMSGSVAQIEDTANRQQSGTTQAAQDVEATKQAIDEMLVQIEGINRISRDMENMSKESADILRELEESSKKAQDTVLDIRNQTDTTNESVKQIKSVTEYITNIAEETNLLALNASIEAARAGDAGRGFAVVAQQIQKLAEESNHSAAQIGENIKDLVEKTEENLAAMNLIGEVLKSQEDKVSRTKDIFGELDRSINMVTDKESNMQQNIKAMNRAKDNMSDVIAELAQSSVTNVNTAQVTAEAAGQMQEEIKGITELGSDLTGLAEDLNQNLQSFLS